MTTADRPRVGDLITTAAQVRALPHGTVVRTHNGILCETQGVGLATPSWYAQGRMLEAQHLPARVLYVPGEQPRPDTNNARAEAERRYPSDVADRGLTYPTGAVREHSQAAFVAGAEWAAGRAETTTEDVYRLAYDVMRHHPGVWYDSLRAAVEALADAGLLATARTRPSLAEISLRLALEMGCERVYDDNANVHYCNEHDVGWLMSTNQCTRAERLADAVLALLGGDDK